MNLDDYLSRDGLGLASLVHRGEVSPRELVEAALRQLDRVNPVLNAVVHSAGTEAREQARKLEAGAAGRGSPRRRESERPFEGVPFLIKDLRTRWAGHPHTCGSRLLADFVPDRDAEVVRRYRASGLLLLGKTNTPELGLSAVTEPELLGPCRNPWNPGLTPGGSSGGSAAAVAAGIVPLAGGNDGGGSIRIPAACCGLFGLKPSRGRVPTGPEDGSGWRGLVVDHVLTRSVRDSAAALDVISGSEGKGAGQPPAPTRPFLAEVGRDPGALRIAFTSKPIGAVEVHPECRRGAETVASLLDELGHHVEEADLPVEGSDFARAFVTLICAETAADLEDAEEMAQARATPGNVEVETWILSLLGRRISGAAYASALRVLDETTRRVDEFFGRYDAVVSPTLAEPPVPVGAFRLPPFQRWAAGILGRLRAGSLFEAVGTLERAAETAFRFAPFTPLFNVTGQPAMSVPLSWTPEEIPVGVHVAGRFGDEATLFRLARQLEVARPWFGRLPAWIRES